MLIYFAGPLFNEAERAFNARLTERLEDRGFSVYLPQRDGFDLDDPRNQRLSDDERQNAIFAMDRDKVLEADIFLFILDGRVPDDGACVELGIAYTQRYLVGRPKLLIGLKTDWRIFFSWAELNAMLWGAFDSVVDNEDQLIEELEAWRAG
jgi:nucleoside 2-deoxyribosyltransferase